jgi:hypothetical protein
MTYKLLSFRKIENKINKSHAVCQNSSLGNIGKRKFFYANCLSFFKLRYKHIVMSKTYDNGITSSFF